MEEKEASQQRKYVSDVDIPTAVDKGPDVADGYQSSFEFDRKAESRLRLKIDLCVVPTVSLLYLFCFIDRANIGTLFAGLGSRC